MMYIYSITLYDLSTNFTNNRRTCHQNKPSYGHYCCRNGK